jgi:hypothetical protein
MQCVVGDQLVDIAPNILAVAILAAESRRLLKIKLNAL